MTMVPQVRSWYEKAQIDYTHSYMALYASFNAWYAAFTGTTNDRQALNTLRRGHSIWSAYCEGLTLRPLTVPMGYLVELTQREPISYASPH